MIIRNLFVQSVLFLWLCLCVLTRNESLMNVYVVTVWVLFIFAIAVNGCLVLLVLDANKLNPNQITKIVKSLQISKSKKIINLLVNIFSIVLLAYFGWLFIAAFYFLGLLIIMFLMYCIMYQLKPRLF